MFGAILSLVEAKSKLLYFGSEYCALALGICEGTWLQRLLRKHKIGAQFCVKMFSDGQAAISITKNPKDSRAKRSRVKHVEALSIWEIEATNRKKPHIRRA